ncbi:hypothetical protein [Sphingobacterium sp. LRF_L2]|uniref:hypothetical protein n=1 Tax=Sphingobacterium sp. LRF_L2 TaxID=3369421 RepID=UPI003F5D95EA
MKKILSLALLLTGISLTTFAQTAKHEEQSERKERRHVRTERHMEKRTPEEVAKNKTERLDKELKFTEVQRKQVYAIQLKQAKREAAHYAEMKKMEGKMHKEMQGSRQDIDKVLTAEQKEVMKAKFAQRKDGVKGKNKPEMRKPSMRENTRG